MSLQLGSLGLKGLVELLAAALAILVFLIGKEPDERILQIKKACFNRKVRLLSKFTLSIVGPTLVGTNLLDAPIQGPLQYMDEFFFRDYVNAIDEVDSILRVLHWRAAAYPKVRLATVPLLILVVGFCIIAPSFFSAKAVDFCAIILIIVFACAPLFLVSCKHEFAKMSQNPILFSHDE